MKWINGIMLHISQVRVFIASSKAQQTTRSLPETRVVQSRLRYIYSATTYVRPKIFFKKLKMTN